VVIGSANSSNTVALEKVARGAGCERVYRVNGPDELPEETAVTEKALDEALDETIEITAITRRIRG